MGGSGSGLDNPMQMWPWQELNVLADTLYDDLKQRVGEIMRESGEDPYNADLFRIRVRQAAHSINARAEKEGRS